MESKRDFYKMISEKRRNLNNLGISNCVGTAEYLIGEKYLDSPSKVNSNKIQGLANSDVPSLGYVIEWHGGEGETFHVGIISKLNPLSVSHRDQFLGDFYKCQKISEIKEENRSFLTRRFKIPSKLQKILDEEESN